MIKVTMDQTNRVIPDIPDISHLIFQEYVGKYIEVPVLPWYQGQYVWGKILKVIPSEEGLLFKTDQGDASFIYARLPRGYHKDDLPINK